MKFIPILMIVLSTSSSCDFIQTQNTDVPKPVVVKTHTCEDAYKNINNLCKQDSVKNAFCCETVAPTKLNVSFVNFCKEVLSEGVDLNVECLSKVTSCEQINVCTGSE